MKFVIIIGIITSSFSLIRLFIAFPAQIKQNQKLQNCEGLASSMVYMTFAGYVLWALYGWAKLDWPLIISSGLGTILSGIIVFQFIYYSRKTQGTRRTRGKFQKSEL